MIGIAICVAVTVLIVALVAKFRTKRPAQKVFLTNSDAKAFEKLLRDNPGDSKKYEHCGKIWNTSDAMPPAIICPVCRNIVMCTKITRI